MFPQRNFLKTAWHLSTQSVFPQNHPKWIKTKTQMDEMDETGLDLSYYFCGVKHLKTN